MWITANLYADWTVKEADWNRLDSQKYAV